MPSPTNFEQEMLELLNRARLDPAGEFDFLVTDEASVTGATRDITTALRYFGVDLDSFRAQLDSYAAVAPLAWNDRLADAAAGHTAAMIDADLQSHQVPGEASLGNRVTAAGYTWSALGENVYAFSQSPLHAHAGFYVDWGYDSTDFSNNTLRTNWASLGDGMQDPAGHRNSMLSATYTEIGMSVIAETDARTSVGPWVVTQNFGTTWSYKAQVVGVVFADANGDGQYTSGEGQGGVSLATEVGTIDGWSSGGYQFRPTQETGPTTFTATLPGLAGGVQVTLDMAGENAKLDFVRLSDGWILRSSTSLTFGTPEGGSATMPITRAVLLGSGDGDLTAGLGMDATLTGNDGANRLTGRGNGADTLTGLGGSDTLTGGDGDDLLLGGDDDDILLGNGGNDTILGGHGNDVFYGQNGADSISGGDGDDGIFGGAGSDTVQAGDGADTVTAGNGRDLVYMGIGDDLFVDNAQGGVNGRDTVYGNVGNDTIGGGAGDDVFFGEHGKDLILGRLGNDRLFGGDQNDTLNAGAGNDTVAGGNGRDRAFLGDGDDQWFDNDQTRFGDDFVVGGSGNDTIRMGGGNDTAAGGTGADVFIFADAIDADRITDYQVGIDALQIDTTLWGGALSQARLDALSNLSSGSLVLDFGDGHSLTFEGLTSTTGLLDDIILV
ncbi:CAP domain-containing protein [Thetidibacter halocola]|uniref:SCP domain-containing protein n=1 Tax=Thetidibacter halocola TaxID=2827239 RepID=A0A8J7WBZ8_9RHOB|nr:CAP domain-containing protein [Thetidibacter halocola]MBS0122636.1 hypothetical protein [Thetidibacter halocola]